MSNFNKKFAVANIILSFIIFIAALYFKSVPFIIFGIIAIINSIYRYKY